MGVSLEAQLESLSLTSSTWNPVTPSTPLHSSAHPLPVPNALPGSHPGTAGNQQDSLGDPGLGVKMAEYVLGEWASQADAPGDCGPGQTSGLDGVAPRLVEGVTGDASAGLDDNDGSMPHNAATNVGSRSGGEGPDNSGPHQLSQSFPRTSARQMALHQTQPVQLLHKQHHSFGHHQHHQPPNVSSPPSPPASSPSSVTTSPPSIARSLNASHGGTGDSFFYCKCMWSFSGQLLSF